MDNIGFLTLNVLKPAFFHILSVVPKTASSVRVTPCTFSKVPGTDGISLAASEPADKPAGEKSHFCTGANAHFQLAESSEAPDVDLPASSPNLGNQLAPPWLRQGFGRPGPATGAWSGSREAPRRPVALRPPVDGGLVVNRGDRLPAVATLSRAATPAGPGSLTRLVAAPCTWPDRAWDRASRR